MALLIKFMNTWVNRRPSALMTTGSPSKRKFRFLCKAWGWYIWTTSSARARRSRFCTCSENLPASTRANGGLTATWGRSPTLVRGWTRILPSGVGLAVPRRAGFEGKGPGARLPRWPGGASSGAGLDHRGERFSATRTEPATARILRSTLSGDRDAATLAAPDTGRGIAPEDIAKLFEPFSKLGDERQGKHTGSGLGLYICRGIAEGHGGRIWCTSAGPGKGAAFHVTLPRQ
ncbi:MAG: sensor histidine kinase [Thermoplasmatota archaeon]